LPSKTLLPAIVWPVAQSIVRKKMRKKDA